MSTIDTSSLQSLGLSGQPQSTSQTSLGQSDFLKLMITQFQNQDPMNPMQNGEFLSQMAQFGTVSGIQGLQDSFSTLASSLSSNQSLQAASLVGRTALAPSDSNLLPVGGSMTGAADLPGAASDVVVGVYDASGQLVRTISLGAQGQGLVNYQWDGTTDDGQQASPGTYQIKIAALVNGKPTDVNNLSQAKIDSVAFGTAGQGLKVHLAGIGDTAFSDVRSIQ